MYTVSVNHLIFIMLFKAGQASHNESEISPESVFRPIMSIFTIHHDVPTPNQRE
jgi:hypothetical protein